MNKYKFQEFLQQNGYTWSGYVAENTRSKYEKYRSSSYDLKDLDNTYILLGSQNDWDETDGYVKVTYEPLVKYIRHNKITFIVYSTSQNGIYELEKDLSDEWVRYQALSVEGYADEILFELNPVIAADQKSVRDSGNNEIVPKKSSVEEKDPEIKWMEHRLAKNQRVVETIRQVRRENLIKRKEELREKYGSKEARNIDFSK